MKNSLIQLFNIHNLTFFLIILLTVALLGFNLNKPFIGHHDFTSAFNGKIAKNFLEFGFFELRSAQFSGFIIDGVNFQRSYTHYLPLLPLLITFSFNFFGVFEWSERLVPLIFSTMGVIFFYLLVSKIYSFKTAIFSTLFYILNPMFFYFGKMPVVDPVIVALFSISFFYFFKYKETLNNKYLYFLIFLIFFSGFISWTAFYIGLSIFVYEFLLKNISLKSFSILFASFCVILLVPLYTFFVTGNLLGGGILDSLISRTLDSGLSFGGVDFNIINYLVYEKSIIFAYFTKITVFFSFLYIILATFFNRVRNFEILISFFIFGVFHIIVFSRYVFVHDFLNIYLLPFLSLTAGLGMMALWDKLSNIGLHFKTRSLLIVLVYLILIAEQFRFVVALNETKMNVPGMSMANELNKLQTNHNQVLILSPRFDAFYGVFTAFYSKHSYKILGEEDIKDKNLLNNYRYLIIFDEDIVDKELYNKLKADYGYKKEIDYTVFSINEK